MHYINLHLASSDSLLPPQPSQEAGVKHAVGVGTSADATSKATFLRVWPSLPRCLLRLIHNKRESSRRRGGSTFRRRRCRRSVPTWHGLHSSLPSYIHFHLICVLHSPREYVMLMICARARPSNASQQHCKIATCHSIFLLFRVSV